MITGKIRRKLITHVVKLPGRVAKNSIRRFQSIFSKKFFPSDVWERKLARENPTGRMTKRDNASLKM